MNKEPKVVSQTELNVILAEFKFQIDSLTQRNVNLAVEKNMLNEENIELKEKLSKFENKVD